MGWDIVQVVLCGKMKAVTPTRPPPSGENTDGEVGGAITRRTGNAELGLRAIQTLESLPDLRLVQMDRSLVQQAARLAAELGLGGADSFYVAVAVRLSLPLATLDADQRERAALRVVWRSSLNKVTS